MINGLINKPRIFYLDLNNYVRKTESKHECSACQKELSGKLYCENCNSKYCEGDCHKESDGENEDNKEDKEVDKKTGEIIFKYSQHQWLSSICVHIENVHELCNLGARKIGLMEDSIHTEMHRGYHYEHAFSYDWNAMQGFHLLMRLAHAVNALSEFTKKLKKWIIHQLFHHRFCL